MADKHHDTPIKMLMLHEARKYLNDLRKHEDILRTNDISYENTKTFLTEKIGSKMMDYLNSDLCIKRIAFTVDVPFDDELEIEYKNRYNITIEHLRKHIDAITDELSKEYGFKIEYGEIFHNGQTHFDIIVT